MFRDAAYVRTLLEPKLISESGNITFRHSFANVRFAAAILKTVAKEPVGRNDEVQQWRSMKHIYSQRFYRYPSFSLAVVIMNKPWVFNNHVNSIPYAGQYNDFDGVCTGTAVKATKSWSRIRYVYTEEVQMIKREECERLLCRSCRIYMCTIYDNRNQYAFSETEGGGLICYETDDPKETNINEGVLVAITSVVNIGLPNLNMRVGLFHKWITDDSVKVSVNKFIVNICIAICLLKAFLS